MATTSIRIDREALKRLKKVAEKEQTSLSGAINTLLDRYERDEFRRSVHEGFKRLREDPEEWADYQRELKAWDVTLMDGLKTSHRFTTTTRRVNSRESARIGDIWYAVLDLLRCQDQRVPNS